MVQNILRRQRVQTVTGLSRSSLYALMAEKKFPKPIKLGVRSVGWIESDVSAWQTARIAERDGKPTAAPVTTTDISEVV